MPVCVLTERVILATHRVLAQEILRALRTRLLDSPGYQIGTMWREIDMPERVVTMDFWADVAFWQRFRMSDENARVLDALEVLLAEPGSVRLLEDSSYRSAV